MTSAATPFPSSRPAAAAEGRLHEGDLSTLGTLERDWLALCDEGPCDQPFFRPSWVRAWLAAFSPEARLVIATAHGGGRLRALLPLERRRSAGKMPARVLAATANVHSCRFDVVHGEGDAGEAARAIWTAIRDGAEFDLLEIPDVPEGGAAFALAAAAEQDGFSVLRQLSLNTPFVPLHGTLEEILARTDAKFRSNLRRRRRKLEGKGEVGLVRTTGFDPDELERFFALERAGWKGAEGTAAACDGATRAFYENAARAGAAEGWLSLYRLTCGGEDVAIHFGLTWKRRYFLPKPAYHEGHRECSPGQLIVHEVLGDAVARGLTEFDFLGPMMEWKADWAPQVRPHTTLKVFGRTLLGRTLHAAAQGEATLRAQAKVILGKGRS